MPRMIDPAGKHLPLKLGKKAARKGAVRFALMNYVDPSKLPKLPKEFGHEDLIGARDWQMFANDQYGDCVWAGAAHETMMWNRMAGRTVSFTDQTVLAEYTAVTGFRPDDPDTDQGTDMEQAAAYRRRVGIADAQGGRHQVAAYLALKPGNLSQLFYALYLGGAVGIGIQFPTTAMAQFDAGKPWDVVKGAGIDGGHYIPLIAKRKNLVVVTWGRLQEMTTAFYRRYCDEAIAYMSLEALTNNRSPEGFDADQLRKDLASLGNVADQEH